MHKSEQQRVSPPLVTFAFTYSQQRRILQQSFTFIDNFVLFKSQRTKWRNTAPPHRFTTQNPQQYSIRFTCARAKIRKTELKSRNSPNLKLRLQTGMNSLSLLDFRLLPLLLRFDFRLLVAIFACVALSVYEMYVNCCVRISERERENSESWRVESRLWKMNLWVSESWDQSLLRWRMNDTYS